MQSDINHYEIRATYDKKKHQIEGVTKITFANTGETPLSEIYLFLYPNLYRDLDLTKRIKEQNKIAYPVNFNPGEIRIISIKDDRDTVLLASDFFGAKGLSEIRLTTPIPPKTSFQIFIRFVTQIPERFGVFGYFRDWATLQGGWHPYLPMLTNGKWDLHGLPPQSHFHLELTVPKRVSPIATMPLFVKEEKKEETLFIGDADAVRFISLSLGENSIEKQKQIGPVTLQYLFSKRNEYYGEQAFESANRAVLFFLSQWDSFPKTKIQLSHASLYQDIVTAGTRLLYLDSKLFKVFPALKKFHEIRVVRGVFRLLWEELLPGEEPWVLELMASVTSEEFAKEYYPNQFQLKRRLKSVAFFPFVDQILYSNDPLLRRIYFDKTLPEQETLYAFHQTIPPLYPQLKKLVTNEVLQTIINDYKDRIQSSENPSLRSLLLAHDKKMEQFFENITVSQKRGDALSPIDFRIEKVTREKIGEKYQTTLDIKKEGLRAEPVEIVIHEKNRGKIPLVWDGEGNEYVKTLTTNTPVLVVTIDPEETTSDRYRGNNRDPIAWKVLLIESNLDYNLTTRFVGFDINLQFQPVYSEKNKINVGFLRGETKEIGSLQYSRVLSNKQRVLVGIAHQSSRAIKSSSDTDGVTANISYLFGNLDITFIQQYTQWLTGRYPEWNMTLRYDQSLFSGDRKSVTYAIFDFRRAFISSNYHQIQTRLLAGGSRGNLFENSRFFLGGQDGVRGYTPLRFQGENISLVSLEYRFPILYETDLNLLGLALTHTLQGALFADWGTVSDRRDLFRSDQYKSAAGVGFRWFIDFLGVMPITFGLDVAWPIDSEIAAEKKPHYYLTGSRVF